MPANTTDRGLSLTPATTSSQSDPLEESHAMAAAPQNQGQTSDGRTNTEASLNVPSPNQERPVSPGRLSTWTYCLSPAGRDIALDKPKDVMISYSHTDRDMMKRVRVKLLAAGISVWVDSTGLRSGVDFLMKIGQAIIDAKLFVSLVSPKCLGSKFCCDELSLAYISNKHLFPVALCPEHQLTPVMDTGSKLMLLSSRLEWTLLYEEPLFNKAMEDLVRRMKESLAQKADKPSASLQRRHAKRGPASLIKDLKSADESGAPLPSETEEAPVDGQSESGQTFLRKRGSRNKLNNKCQSVNSNHPFNQLAHNMRDSAVSTRLFFSLTPTLDNNISIGFFWDRFFGEAKTVPWNKFEGEFRKEHGEDLDQAYTRDEQDWMLKILYKELIEEDDATVEDEGAASPNRSEKLVIKSKYDEYCNIDGKRCSFWDRLQCQIVERFAVKTVFSTAEIRLTAIENLSKFKSIAVVEALIDLFWDKDPNIRAIAAIAVGKSGYKSGRKSQRDESGRLEDVDDLLIELLKDEDRLVREGACIALGHRQCQKSVSPLLNIWRKGNISLVQHAAQEALRIIGGEEANRAIHMTTILEKEMKMLMDLNEKKPVADKPSPEAVDVSLGPVEASLGTFEAAPDTEAAEPVLEDKENCSLELIDVLPNPRNSRDLNDNRSVEATFDLAATLYLGPDASLWTFEAAPNTEAAEPVLEGKENCSPESKDVLPKPHDSNTAPMPLKENFGL